MRWSQVPEKQRERALLWAGGVALAALGALAFAAASPAQAVSLQWHTQVSDADFVIGGGPSDLAPTSMATGRWNGDNRSDLAMCSVANNSCWLYYGTGSIGDARLLGEPDVIFVGPNGAFGASVTFIGDVNGDGLEELAVGAPNATGEGGVLGGGSLWLFFGRNDAFRGQVGYYDANTTVFGRGAGDNLGFSASAAGDVDGDGYGDFWVGAPNASDAGVQVGAVLLYRGRFAWPTELYEGAASLRLVGNSQGGGFGRVLLGKVDLNNDSRWDLLTSSTKYRDRSGAAVGAAFAFAAPFPLDGRTVNASRANITFWGNSLVPTLGSSLAFAPDFTKEGGRVVLVGAPAYSNNTSSGGSVYVFKITAVTCCQTVNAWDAVGLLYTKEPNDQAGLSLAGGGDIDHDGFSDLILGAPSSEVGTRTDAGRVFIVYGNDTSRQPLLLDDRAEGLEGKGNRSYLGNLVQLADFNGDGWADLIVSAPGDPLAASQGGAVYGFVGRPRNRAPVVSLNFTGNLTEGAEITVRANITDADRDRLTWEWAGATDGRNHDGVRFMVLVYDDEGTGFVLITVFDGTLSTIATLLLEIANAPPVCEIGALSPFVEGEVGYLVVNVSDPGTYDSWNVLWQGPPGMSWTGTNAVYEPSRGGNFTVSVEAVDEDAGYGLCALDVDIENVPPAVTIVGPTLLYEGATAIYTARIDDPGIDDAFFYNWTGPDGVTNETSTMFYAARPGRFAVEVRVVDLDEGSGYAQTIVTVINVAPDVGLIVPGGAIEGEAPIFEVKQYGGFSFDVISVSWLVCLPGYGDGLLYRVSPAEPGDYCVQALVFDDDSESASFNMTFTVTNRAPLASVRVRPDPPYREGDKITFDPVFGAWETTPAGLMEFAWSIDGDEVSKGPALSYLAVVGSHRVTVVATDLTGGVSRFNLTIAADNAPPTVTISGDDALVPGAIGVWRAHASDPSGAQVHLTWDVDGQPIVLGEELQWSSRSPGTHVVRVTADDGSGGITVASMLVTVSPPPSTAAGIDLRWVAVPLGAAAAFAAGILLGAYVIGRIRGRRPLE